MQKIQLGFWGSLSDAEDASGGLPASDGCGGHDAGRTPRHLQKTRAMVLSTQRTSDTIECRSYVRLLTRFNHGVIFPSMSSTSATAWTVPPRLRFQVKPLGRPDDRVRIALASWCERTGTGVADLAIAARIDPRTLWAFMSGRSSIRSDNLCAVLNASGHRLLAPDEAEPFTPAR